MKRRLFPDAQLRLGAEANKAALLSLRTPRILHIGTHGFFLEDIAQPAASNARAKLQVPQLGGVAQCPSDPLLRSGIVLAGADVSGDHSLLTALELAGLNLWGTELVVLSACDSGRGEIKRGQGVYGLRRALIVAGAETVVTSLWSVNDETTATLMESYYQHLLAGRGRAAALREAMLSVRAQKPHPHYWAPFISIGKDGPLKVIPQQATASAL